jgi:hypothetical protein
MKPLPLLMTWTLISQYHLRREITPNNRAIAIYAQPPRRTSLSSSSSIAIAVVIYPQPFCLLWTWPYNYYTGPTHPHF